MNFSLTNVRLCCTLEVNMSHVIQTTTLRNNLSDVLDDVEQKKADYLLVARKGKISAVLVNLDVFEDMLALSSPSFVESIKKARREVEKGQIYTHEELFGKL